MKDNKFLSKTNILYTLLLSIILIIDKLGLKALSEIINPIYLPKTYFGELNIVSDDLSSEEFFQKFEIDMISGQNDYSNYYRECSDGNIFGFFQKGNISTFFLYETYGSLSINFNILLMEDDNDDNDEDKLNFYFNDELAAEVYLKNITNSTSSFTSKTTSCGIKVYTYYLNLKYIYDNSKGYFPLSLVIQSDFSLFTNRYWGFKDFYVETVKCSPKCSVCNSTACIGCEGEYHSFTGSTCTCKADTNSTQEVFDYADSNKEINCQCKDLYFLIIFIFNSIVQYTTLFNEDYLNPLSKYEWIWNENKIYPYYFKTNCSLNDLNLFGGYQIFGNGDTLNKVVKYSDSSYNLTSISSYKIELTLHFFSWTTSKKLTIYPYTTSEAIEMNLSDDEFLCKEDSTITYFTTSYSYSGLYDKDTYANITMILGQTESRMSNNFGLSKFTFYVSNCHISCLTCSDPSVTGCNSCRDSNAILSYGSCTCKTGYKRDLLITNDFVCVKSVSSIIIDIGSEKTDTTLSTYADFAILNHNLPKSTKICSDTRSIVGGKKSYSSIYSHIDIIVQEIGKKYYMKRLIMQILTEEDNILLYQFTTSYNGNVFQPNKISVKQVYFQDDIAKDYDNTCYEPIYKNKTETITETTATSSTSSSNSTNTTTQTSVKTTTLEVVNTKNYKMYQIEHLIVDISSSTDIKISNAVTNFWGIYSFQIDYYECHTNCNKCLSSTRNDCLQCSAGMITNQDFYNEAYSKNTYSCLCDQDNGYYKTSSSFNPLTCTNRVTSHYYYDDLNEDILNYYDWRSFEDSISSDNLISCNSLPVIIIGYQGITTDEYLERDLEFEREFNYFSFEVSFTLYQFELNTSNNLIKVFFDDYYVYGNNLSKFTTTIICDVNNNIYSYSVSFIVYVSDTFSKLDFNQFTLRIEYYPNSSCKLNTKCGWGINYLSIKANLSTDELTKNEEKNIIENSNCVENSNDACTCFPEFYTSNQETSTDGNGDVTCQNCPSNCMSCSSASSCETCSPGYFLSNESCVKVSLSLAASQKKILTIDLQRYYSNYNYIYKGFSLNVWVTMSELLSNEKPIIAANPYLITYNCNLGRMFYVRYDDYNSQYWKSSEFTKIMNYQVSNETQDYYEKNWLAISLSLYVTEINDENIIYVQFSVHSDKAESVHFDGLSNIESPISILLFNYFSGIKYRNLKYWDRYIPIKELRQQNYINTPEELLVYYKFVEGKFNNLGVSSLIYVNNKSDFVFEEQSSNDPTVCEENQYYDFDTSTCVYCHVKCQSCYGPGANQCFKCKYPYKYKNSDTRTCEQFCHADSFPNFRYLDTIPCDLECPSECKTCDKILGCLSCIDGFMLYNSKCIKQCLPEIAPSISGCITDENATCTPTFVFNNTPEYFFLDGSNFKLEALITACNLDVNLTWQSSLSGYVIYFEDDKSYLILKSDTLSDPGNYDFTLTMTNKSGKVLATKTVTVPFVLSQINGGMVNSYYLGQNITLSLKFFDENVIKKSTEDSTYTWTCPYWAVYTECNGNMNTPEIVMTQTDTSIDDGLTYETLVSAKCKVTQGTATYDFVGFAVVYYEYSLEDYLAFSIKNSTVTGLNNDLSFYLEFEKTIDTTALKNDISIYWTIDSEYYKLTSSNRLPYISYSPTSQESSSKTIAIAAEVIYREHTNQKTVLKQTYTFTLDEYPIGGNIIIDPTSGVSTVTSITIASEKWVSTKFKNFINMYYYQDPYGNLQPIYNKKNLQSESSINYSFNFNITAFTLETEEENDYNNLVKGQLNNDIITKDDDMGSLISLTYTPPTSLIVHRLYFGNDNSYYESKITVSYTENYGINFNDVIDIFEYSISPSLQQLEVYALNFRSDSVISKSSDIEKYGSYISGKLFDIISNNINLSTSSEGELLLNMNKICLICDSVSRQLLNYNFTNDTESVSEITNNYNSTSKTNINITLNSYTLSYLEESIKLIIDLIDKYEKSSIYSKDYFTNMIRCLDNLINVKNKFISGIEFFKSELLKLLTNIMHYTSLSTQVGLDKVLSLNSIEMLNQKLNTLFMQNNYVIDSSSFNIDSNSSVNDNSDTNSTNVTNSTFASISLIPDYYTYNSSLTNNNTIYNENYEVLKSKFDTEFYIFIDKDILQNNYIDCFTELSVMKINNYNSSVLKSIPTTMTPLVNRIISLKFIGNNTNPNYYANINNTSSTSNTTNTTKRLLQDTSIASTENDSNNTTGINNTNSTNSSDIENNQASINKSSIEYFASLKSYYKDSSAFSIYFKLPELSYDLEILTKATCAIYNETSESYMEDICNTWFDFNSYFVLCDCDIIGPITVIYNPDFLYERKLIQFPQVEEGILGTWGMSTIIFLSSFFILLCLRFYIKDKNELKERNEEKIKNNEYMEFRGKMKNKLFKIKEITFKLLYDGIVDQSNEYYSLNYLSDFYYLRIYRALFFFVRLYSLILFCFYKQKYYLDPEIEQKVNNRDVTIREDRLTIYNWSGNYFTEIVNNLYYAIPISLVMVVFPKLAEWLFRYDEELLKYQYYSKCTVEVSNEYYKKKIGAYKLNDAKIKIFKKDENFNPFLKPVHEINQYNNNNLLNNNATFRSLELSDITRRKLKDDTMINYKNSNNNIIMNNKIEINNEDLLQERLKEKENRNYLAYLNFMKMNFVILNDIRYQNFLNEKGFNFPESIAPLYSQRISNLYSKYWSRLIEVKIMLHKEMQMDQDEEKLNNFNVLKNMSKQIENAELFLKNNTINAQIITMNYDQDLKISNETIEKTKMIPSYIIKKKREEEFLAKLEKAKNNKLAQKQLEEKNKELMERERHFQEVSFKLEFDKEDKKHYVRKNKYLALTKGIAKLFVKGGNKLGGSSLISKMMEKNLIASGDKASINNKDETNSKIMKMAGLFGIIAQVSDNKDIKSLAELSKKMNKDNTANNSQINNNVNNDIASKNENQDIISNNYNANVSKEGDLNKNNNNENKEIEMSSNMPVKTNLVKKLLELRKKREEKKQEEENKINKNEDPENISKNEEKINSNFIPINNNNKNRSKSALITNDKIQIKQNTLMHQPTINDNKRNSNASYNHNIFNSTNLNNVSNNIFEFQTPDMNQYFNKYLNNNYNYSINHSNKFDLNAPVSADIMSNSNFNLNNYSNINDNQLLNPQDYSNNNFNNYDNENNGNDNNNIDIDEIDEDDLDQVFDNDEKSRYKSIIDYFLTPSNALVPHFVYKNKDVFFFLVIKSVIILLCIATLVYWITKLIVSVRSNGGINRAIFWIILAALAIVENYIIIVPCFSFAKTILLKKYGIKNSKRFKWTIKEILYFFIISNLDKAVYQELKECVRNNLEKENTDKEYEPMFNYQYTEEKDKYSNVKKVNRKSIFKRRISTKSDHDDDSDDGSNSVGIKIIGNDNKVSKEENTYKKSTDEFDDLNSSKKIIKDNKINNDDINNSNYKSNKKNKVDESIDDSQDNDGPILFNFQNQYKQKDFDYANNDNFYQDSFDNKMNNNNYNNKSVNTINNQRNNKYESSYYSESMLSNYKVSEEAEHYKDNKLKLFDKDLYTNQVLKNQSTNAFNNAKTQDNPFEVFNISTTNNLNKITDTSGLNKNNTNNVKSNSNNNHIVGNYNTNTIMHGMKTNSFFENIDDNINLNIGGIRLFSEGNTKEKEFYYNKEAKNTEEKSNYSNNSKYKYDDFDTYKTEKENKYPTESNAYEESKENEESMSVYNKDKNDEFDYQNNDKFE